MSTTKPPRARQTQQPTYDRQAERRAALHRDIDAILDAEQHAILERDSIGFGTNRSFDSSGGSAGATIVVDGQVIDTVELTSVERAVVQGRHLHRATDWLAEHTEALAAITRVANIARANWQPPAAGTTTGGVTIGARTTISCTHCGDRITSDDPGKGLAGDLYHERANDHHGACFWTVWRSRRQASHSNEPQP